MENKELQNVKNALTELENVLPEIGDIFEDMAIIVDDVAQLYFAEDSKKFVVEKADARKQVKVLKRKLDNATFKNFGKNRIK
jgi:hypothetical protein